MSEADKIFERLGYKKSEDKDNIFYSKYQYGEKWICFEKSSWGNSFYGVFEQNGDRMPLIFSISELKAINKKVEELGWND